MSLKAIIFYVLGLFFLIGLLVVFGSERARTSSFTANNLERPIAQLETDHADFGEMTNQEIKSYTFKVTNVGKSDLELTQVSTSCDCTYAYITAGGQKSHKFTMHGHNDWIGKVAPGQSATVEVIYEPAIMPVQGSVERIVTVATNDPVQPTLTFHVTANVKD
jgi:hypothetical protein